MMSGNTEEEVWPTIIAMTPAGERQIRVHPFLAGSEADVQYDLIFGGPTPSLGVLVATWAAGTKKLARLVELCFDDADLTLVSSATLHHGDR